MSKSSQVSEHIHNSAHDPLNSQPQNIVPLIFQQLQSLDSKIDANHAILQKYFADEQTRQSQERELGHDINELRNDLQLLREACSMFATGTRPTRSSFFQSMQAIERPSTPVSPRLPASIPAPVSMPTSVSMPTPVPIPTPVSIPTSTPARVPTNVPKNKCLYSLSRDISTVPELWREWSVGLGRGKPSVLELNKTKGTSWRCTPKERQFYSRRLVIINKIYKVQETNNCSIEEAVRAVEMFRTEMKWSLSKLTKELKNQ
ncbi:transcriptional activator of glycolytic enzymes-domain-containing protein [Phycomyces nitens]|nr:transcriptional activator of glycolytic enzymes-domain-containing protein [Phycomyces nitens]